MSIRYDTRLTIPLGGHKIITPIIIHFLTHLSKIDKEKLIIGVVVETRETRLWF